MTTPRMFLAGLIVLTAACSDSKDSGTPPTITALTCTPTTLPVGAPSTLECVVSFSDAEGDVDRVASWVQIAGMPLSFPDVLISSNVPLAAGQVTLTLQLGSATASEGELHVTVLDKAGNESAEATVVVQFVAEASSEE